uniref:Uncharacterized protein n=1 Tax=Anopheles christyi TaxID=43041 RepID=A0A182KDG0_9DIPT
MVEIAFGLKTVNYPDYQSMTVSPTSSGLIVLSTVVCRMYQTVPRFASVHASVSQDSFVHILKENAFYLRTVSLKT